MSEAPRPVLKANGVLVFHAADGRSGGGSVKTKSLSNSEVATLVRGQLAKHRRRFELGPRVAIEDTGWLESFARWRGSRKNALAGLDPSRVITEFVAPSPLKVSVSSLDEAWSRVGGYIRESMNGITVTIHK